MSTTTSADNKGKVLPVVGRLQIGFADNLFTISRETFNADVTAVINNG